MKLWKLGAGFLSAALMGACATTPPEDVPHSETVKATSSQNKRELLDEKCGHETTNMGRKLCEVGEVPTVR